MYNRYIPQADGTYRRSRVETPVPRPSHAQEPISYIPPEQACEEEDRTPVRPQKQISRQNPGHRPQPPRREPIEGSVSSFLKQLLPGSFDTADLFVILLLLLMSGDCKEDQSTALLTLALYLFM